MLFIGYRPRQPYSSETFLPLIPLLQLINEFIYKILYYTDEPSLFLYNQATTERWYSCLKYSNILTTFDLYMDITPLPTEWLPVVNRTFPDFMIYIDLVGVSSVYVRTNGNNFILSSSISSFGYSMSYLISSFICPSSIPFSAWGGLSLTDSEDSRSLLNSIMWSTLGSSIFLCFFPFLIDDYLISLVEFRDRDRGFLNSSFLPFSFLFGS